MVPRLFYALQAGILREICLLQPRVSVVDQQEPGTAPE